MRRKIFQVLKMLIKLLASVLLVHCHHVMSVEKPVDLTLGHRATGEDVIDAVIWRALSTKIFPADHCYYKREAYILTNFGDIGPIFDPNTGDSVSYNNIWQIHRSHIDDMLKKLPDQYHTSIKSKLGIDLNALGEDDLWKPLISYLAAFSYDFTNKIQNIPEKLDDQANQFHQKWGANGKDQNLFLNKVRKKYVNKVYLRIIYITYIILKLCL